MCSLQPRLWRLSVQLRCLHKMTACASQSQTAATVPQDPALDALVCGSLSSRAFASSSSSPPSSPELEASPQIPLSAFESKQTKTTSLVGQIDRHNGVTVDVSYLPVNLGPGEFSRLLRESLDVWRAEDRAAIWLRLPLERSQLIQCAAAEGFLFHHAEGSEATMSLWLRTDKEDMTPTFATHQLGVSAYTPAYTPPYTPAYTAAYTPAHTPAYTPAITPAYTPAFTPAYRPADIPAYKHSPRLSEARDRAYE